VKRYEFADLYFYLRSGTGSLYNFRTDAPLKAYGDGRGLPYTLQQLSDEGWQIVHIDDHIPQADNDYDKLVYLQREVTGG